MAVASLTACGSKDKDPEKKEDKPKDTPAAGSSEAKAEPAKKPAEAEPAPKKDPAVDAALVAAAKKVAAECKWIEDQAYFESCDARTAWEGQRLEARHAATLLSLLEEKTPQMMHLASHAFYREDWYREDKALQERIFAVAEALPADLKGGTANKIGRTIGFFKLDKTGLTDRAKALAEKADANEALRIGLANWLLAGNQESEPLYELTRDLATKGATPGIQVAALVALSAAYNHHATDEMCKLWLEALPRLDDRPAAMIASHLTKGDLQVNNQNDAFPYNWAMISSDDNKCSAETVDSALKLIEKRVDDGTATDYWWTSALKGPHVSKNATPAHKKKAIEIAKKYSANAKYGGYQRGQAIDLLVDLDPPTAKALADKYKDDKDASLKSAAERVTKRLAEAKKSP
ncbi:MAG: hypothetical protein KIT31_38950 [Deltaproteobacteria bacterium]|nr:hypothetical protein [Deltaproteobacteria bacterium]